MWSGIGGAHGGFGFGKRNVEDEMILKFADELNQVVLNRWFTRMKGDYSHTYESSKSRTVVDYIEPEKEKEERKIIRVVTGG